MLRLFLFFGAMAFLALSACDDNASHSHSGLLRQVTSAEEFEASLKEGLTAIRTIPQPDTALGANRDGFTTTYTLEENVDEADVVKYDGKHIFIAPQRGYSGCCFRPTPEDSPVGAALQTPDPVAERSIRILSTDVEAATATEIVTIPLAQNRSVQGMYLVEDRLVALMTETFWGRFGELWRDSAVWADQTTGLAIYDTSDASNPTLSFEAQIEGSFIESRRVGNTVYFISRYTPTIEGLTYYVTTVEEQATNQALLQAATLDDMLPKIQINGEATTLVEPLSCYVTNEAAGAGYPIITSITAVPIDNPFAYRTTCYNEDAYGAYVSERAIYLSQHRAVDGANNTRLHKFGIDGIDVEYRGSADIEGILWTGGQNDFRINEHDGYVRAVTTAFGSAEDDRIDHQLFILRESESSLALDTVARLPNDSQPKEIGKPNERLYGVRFLGDRAYAVTFETIDPLYVIDLTDPRQPRIVGELEVTGFSDFLHAVTPDLLLGLGRSEIGAIKLELFDVEDISNPLSLGSETLGGAGSYSEARFDRHAFTYQPDVDGIDRFVIPADVYSTQGTYEPVESGLFLYEIHDKMTPRLARLVPAGALITNNASAGEVWFAGSRNRSILHDDTIYYARDEEIWATFWLAPAAVKGPF